MKFKDKLQKLRKEHDLSQEQLAYQLNISRQAVSKWESGSAYPEMDKIIAISKIFNCSVEYLTNDELTENDLANKKDECGLKKYVKIGLDYVTKTMNMFYSMKFKSIVKCLFELSILILVIVLLEVLLVTGIVSILESITSFMPYSISYAINNILLNILTFIAVITGVVIVLHIFKVRYLDYYDQALEKSKIDNKKIINEDKNNNVEENNLDNNQTVEVKKTPKIEIGSQHPKIEYIEKKEPKIIIRDPSDKPFAIFDMLLKCIKVFIKIMVACTSSMFVISFSGLIIFLIILLYLLFDGINFFGLILGTIGIIAINYEVLNIVYKFLVSKKQNFKRIYIVLISGIIISSIGAGIFIIDIKDYTYIDNLNDIIQTEETEHEYKITSDFCIMIHDKSITYIEDESINDKTIKIKVRNDQRFTKYVIDEAENSVYIYGVERTISLKDIYDILKIDAKNKVIRDYNKTLELEILVYGNKNSLTTLKNAMNKKFYNWTDEKINNKERIYYSHKRVGDDTHPVNDMHVVDDTNVVDNTNTVDETDYE